MALFRIESGASYDMSYEGEFEEPMGVAVGDDVGLAVGGDDETSDAAPVSRVPSSLSLRRGSRLSLHRASCFSMHALNLSLRDHLSECTEMLAAEPALARAIVAHRGFHAIDDALGCLAGRGDKPLAGEERQCSIPRDEQNLCYAIRI